MKAFSVAVCVIFVVSCSARQSAHPLEFHVEFNHAVPLKSGGRVCFLGVPVGKIERVTVAQLSRGSQPVIDVAVSLNDSRVRVRKADSFRIASEGLIGPEYLEIDPAKGQSPPLANGSTVIGEQKETVFSPNFTVDLQPLAEIARKLAALPPGQRKLMLAKFLKLLDQSSSNRSHESAAEPGGSAK